MLVNMSPNVGNTVAWLVLCGWYVCNASTDSTRFVQDAAFGGFTCAMYDTVLDMTDVTKIVCARACQRNPICRSMFYVPLSKRCMGCVRKYQTGDVLQVILGTQYYYDEAVVTFNEQWVMSVTGFSSQDSPDIAGWDAIQIIGAPDVYPSYGDIEEAWTSDIAYDMHPFIEVKFAEAVNITGVMIFETFHAGGVNAIKAKDAWGNWKTLWSTANVQDIEAARIFAPLLSVMDSPSGEIRIELDYTVAGTWVEIDAVKLLGT